MSCTVLGGPFIGGAGAGRQQPRYGYEFPHHTRRGRLYSIGGVSVGHRCVYVSVGICAWVCVCMCARISACVCVRACIALRVALCGDRSCECFPPGKNRYPYTRVLIYVCTTMYVCACVCTHVPVCMFAWRSVFVWICAQLTCVWLCVCVLLCVLLCVRAYRCLCLAARRSLRCARWCAICGSTPSPASTASPLCSLPPPRA